MGACLSTTIESIGNENQCMSVSRQTRPHLLNKRTVELNRCTMKHENLKQSTILHFMCETNNTTILQFMCSENKRNLF